MDPWIKSSTTIKSNGEKTIRYESFRNQNMIESRKMAIPHSGRSGFWYRTTFFLIRPDGTEKEFYSLRAAKEAAEKEGMKNDPV